MRSGEDKALWQNERVATKQFIADNMTIILGKIKIGEKDAVDICICFHCSYSFNKIEKYHSDHVVIALQLQSINLKGAVVYLWGFYYVAQIKICLKENYFLRISFKAFTLQH